MDAPLIFSPEPTTTPARVTLPPGVPVVQLRHHGVTLDQLPDLFDAGYAVLAGLGPAGPGFAIYDGEVMESFDLTIGFPVAARPSAVPTDVETTTFPTGEAMLLTHTGSYEAMMGSWERLVAAAEQQGLQVARAVEIYLSDPSVTAPADLRTDLVAVLG